MTSVESRGWTIDYAVSGDGPAVLLIAGISQWGAQWSELGYVDALADDFRVVTIDILGHGDSDKPHDAAAYNPRGIVSDLVEVLDQEDIPSVTAWGFSFGVQHVTDLASVAPSRVHGLVCGSGDLRPPREEELLNVNALAAILRAPGGIEAMWQSVGYVGDDRVAVGLSHNDVEALACFCEGRPLWRPETQAFPMPTVAYWGSHETEPAALIEVVGSSLECFQVDNADHFGAFARADEVLTSVRPFLERTAVGSELA